MNGGAGLGKLGRERARERGERVVELPGMLMRAIERSGGLCPGRATAAARWQPRAWKLAGGRWRGRAAQSGGRAAHDTGGEREQRETDRQGRKTGT